MRSIVAPVVLGVAGFALVAILSLLGVALLTVEASNDAALRRATDLEIAALADSHATGGADETARRIGDRLALQPVEGGGAHYLLQRDGRRLAGDIPRWPALSAERSESGYLLFDGRKVFARATLLGPGLRLLAAREAADPGDLRHGLVSAFALAGGLFLAAASILSFFGIRHLRRRVDRMNSAFEAIEAGAIDRPIPGAASRDELGELARHVARLTARLGALVQVQRNITDIVAHEVRTPLARLNARATRLIEQTQDRELAEAVGQLRGDVRDAGRLLDSLLDIAASEKQQGDETGFVEVDLASLAERMRDLYADTADEQGIMFAATAAAGVAMRGDPMQLTRLLSNLIDNAFKHVPPQGKIELTVEPGPRITVRDNGAGVPEELRERIFEPFVRGESRATAGHGLGLALARSIARRHGLRLACFDAQPGAAFVLEPETAG